jgi:hypothetical protein
LGARQTTSELSLTFSAGRSRRRGRPSFLLHRTPILTLWADTEGAVGRDFAPPIAVGAAIVTFAVWVLFGDGDAAVIHTVTVLVISCPHALGLAIPLVIAISTSLAARSGILVKDRLSLERSRLVDVVLVDKTGTLTRGFVLAAGTERLGQEALSAAVGKAGRSLAPCLVALPQRGIAGVNITKRWSRDELGAI